MPEPLTVGDPLVTFEVMKMPDVTGLGAFTESGQVLTVEHEGEPAAYLHAMYVDNLGSITSGREISAFPKKFGNARLHLDVDTLVGTLDYRTPAGGDGDDGLQARARCPSTTRAPRSPGRRTR